jgi:hypothetical protein
MNKFTLACEISMFRSSGENVLTRLSNWPDVVPSFVMMMNGVGTAEVEDDDVVVVVVVGFVVVEVFVGD